MKKDLLIEAQLLASEIWTYIPELESLDVDKMAESLAIVGYAAAMVAARAKEVHNLNTAPVLIQGLRLGLLTEDRSTLTWEHISEDGEKYNQNDLDGEEVRNGFGCL